MSASTTKLWPWLPASRIASNACVALFFGRKTKLLAWKSASKIGSIGVPSGSFAAICTTRSRTVGIPNGRCFPSAFGMYRRFTGEGRYRPARNAASISAKNSPTPRCSIAWIVSASIPAAPRLLRTRLHASLRTSLLKIRSYSAWNRRVLLCLAHTYSLRWSCRTFSGSERESDGTATFTQLSSPAEPRGTDVGHRHPLGRGRRRSDWCERDAEGAGLRLNWVGHGERLDEGVGISGIPGL